MSETNVANEEEIMKSLGESSDVFFRLGVFFGGILGLFFPGWYMYRSIQLYKTLEDNPDFRDIKSMIEKIDITPKK